MCTVMSAVDGQNAQKEAHASGLDDAAAAAALTEAKTIPVPRWQLWTLWTAIAAVTYVLGLGSFTLAVYFNLAAARFNAVVQYTTLAVVQSLILSVGQPPLAKCADVLGRATTWTLSLLFYTLGIIIMASSHSFNTLAAGIVFYAIGYTGLYLLEQILIADVVVPSWRVVVQNVLLFPYLINFAVAGKITGALAATEWRWGIGMYAILIVVVTSPVIIVLYIQDRAARRLGIVKANPYAGLTPLRAGFEFLLDIDLIGLLVLTAAFALILIPLTIADNAPDGYDSGYIIAMLVIGCVCLVAWPIIELKMPRPMVELKEFFFNLDVLVPTLVYAIDQFSTTLSYQPAFQWSLITFGWSTQNATYFFYAQSLSNTVFSMVAGGIAAWTGRYKWLSFAGGCLRVLGVGLMLRYRDGSSTVAQVVIPQVIQGIGGGMLTANLAVAAQQAVSHARVAIVTGVVLLIVNLGDAIGSAVTGAVQQNLLGQLHATLDPITGNSTLAIEVYGGGSTIAEAYPLGSPIRDAIIDAWATNMRQLLIGALVSGIINALLVLPMRDRTLQRHSQNNVADEPVESFVRAKAKETDQSVGP